MAKKAERLTPGTDILLTFWNHKMSTADALSEFIDNSFGEAAGNARRCEIRFFKRTIEIIDNGDGIKDMNAMFRLAESKSRSHKSDIGGYGVGAKYGMAHFGKKAKVQTVCDGVYHQRTVDWGQCVDTGLFPLSYTAPGSARRNAPATIRNHGAIVTISDFHKGRHRPAFEDLAKQLALRYWPALRGGRQILIEDTRSAFNLSLSDRLLAPHFTGEEFTAESTAAGRSFKIHYARIKEYDRDMTGLHIAFGHRIIVHKDKLGDQTLPQQFYAEVALGNDWKTCLSPNKNAIISYEKELLGEIYRLLKPFISELDRAAREIRIYNILAIASGVATNVLRLLPPSDGDYQRIKPEPSERQEEPEPQPGPGPSPPPPKRKRTPPVAELGGKRDAEQDPDGQAIIKFDLRDDLAEVAFRVMWKGNQCTVLLNQKVETIAYAMEAPFKMAVLWPIIAAAFAHDCAQREHPESMFINPIGILSDTEKGRSEIIPRVMKWVLDQRKAAEDFDYEAKARHAGNAA